METDASDFAIGACLRTIDERKNYKPIAYYSRKLSPAELNYDVHDKELLAIVVAFEQWRVYLEGPKHTVQVWTDHKNLTTFTTPKSSTKTSQVVRNAVGIQLHHRIQKRIGKRKGRRFEQAQEYAGKPTERPRAILKNNENGIEYNHELLATIAVVENTNSSNESRTHTCRRMRHHGFKGTNRRVHLDQQGLLRFKGLVYIPSQDKGRIRTRTTLATRTRAPRNRSNL